MFFNRLIYEQNFFEKTKKNSNIRNLALLSTLSVFTLVSSKLSLCYGYNHIFAFSKLHHKCVQTIISQLLRMVISEAFLNWENKLREPLTIGSFSFHGSTSAALEINAVKLSSLILSEIWSSDRLFHPSIICTIFGTGKKMNSLKEIVLLFMNILSEDKRMS